MLFSTLGLPAPTEQTLQPVSVSNKCTPILSCSLGLDLLFFCFATPSSNSWFHQIRNLCLKYSLPHPATLLSTPPTKEAYKSLVKKHVVNYWELLLRSEAESLPSLEFFHPSYMSLSTPHPLWRTAGASPTKVVMATVQARFLSGR